MTIRRHACFRSRYLCAGRDVLVYLPPGRTPHSRHPVLYLHDGQNVFDGSTSFRFGQTWRAGETVDALVRAGAIEPLIVVAVSNAGTERANEYTPTWDKRAGAGGRADDYGRLLTHELKPFIDATYPTRPGPLDTGLGGSSLGGLASLYLGLRRPDVWGKLIVMSPSVWWSERAILGQVAAVPNTVVRPRVWLDIGTGEGSPRALPDARLLREALVRAGWTSNDLGYIEAENAGHDEAAWAARLPDALRFLFGG